MGNNQPQKYELPKYEWTWAGNHNGLDLYQRHSDGVLAEKRKVMLDSRFPLERQKQIYKLRQTNNLGFVRVYQVDGVEEEQKKEQSNFCKCAESPTFNVYSERIEHRLSDLPQLTFAESLRLLWDTTNSFQQIYQKFGPFHINAELIGITLDNKVKVWVNENFALNHPSHQIPYLKTMTNYQIPPQLRNQNEMINNLLQVIEQKTEKGRFPSPFREEIYKNNHSFQELKRYLNHYMQNQYRDYIPDTIKRSTVIVSQNQLENYGYPPNNVMTTSAQLPQNGNIKQSFIHTQFHPIEQTPLPFQPDRVNTSINPTIINKPVVNFGSNYAPEARSGIYSNSIPNQAYQPIVISRPPEPGQLIENKPLAFPKFTLPNEGSIQQNPPLYVQTQPNATFSSQTANYEEPRPDLQLQKIRNMLRQDISQMNGQRTQSRQGETIKEVAPQKS